MKYKYDVYLACRMHFRQVGDVLLQTSIAKAFCKKYGLTYYCPGDDEGLATLARTSIIDPKPNLDDMTGYVNKDDANLDRCKFLLVLTGDTSSSGTAWEMGRMYYKNKRPIVIVAPKTYYGQLTNFTTIKASYIRPTIESAIWCIRSLIRGKVKCHTSTKG